MLTQSRVLCGSGLFVARIALTLSGGLVQLVHHPNLEAVALHDDVYCRNVLVGVCLDQLVNVHIDDLVLYSFSLDTDSHSLISFFIHKPPQIFCIGVELLFYYLTILF